MDNCVAVVLACPIHLMVLSEFATHDSDIYKQTKVKSGFSLLRVGCLERFCGLELPMMLHSVIICLESSGWSSSQGDYGRN